MMQVVEENKPNPNLCFGRDINKDQEIYGKIGVTRQQDWEKYSRYINVNRERLVPPTVEPAPFVWQGYDDGDGI